MSEVKGNETDVMRALYGSPETLLPIGNRTIQCYVLEDGTAVLSGRGMQDALDLGQAHGSKFKDLMNEKSLKPFINNDLAMEINSPIKFKRPGRGGRPANGYEATLLTKICRVILSARRSGVFDDNLKMQHIAAECEIIISAFTDVGIIATIYEITGYEKHKAFDAYQKFLEKFIRKEVAAYVQRFPILFFELMCDLKGWSYQKGRTRYLPAMGHIINDVVYSRLAPGVLEELNSVNPKINGKRKYKQHSWLTLDMGVPALNEHLIGVMALAKANSSWARFYAQLSVVYPVYNDPQLFLFPPDQIADMIVEEERKVDTELSPFNENLKKALEYDPNKDSKKKKKKKKEKENNEPSDE